jgi:hypothetical protein
MAGHTTHKAPNLKLSQSDYEQICAVLAHAPRVTFTTGKGRARSPYWSHGALARQYGVARATITRIAGFVRQGTQHRLYGVRAMQCTPDGRWREGVALAAPAGTGEPGVVLYPDKPRMQVLLEMLTR